MTKAATTDFPILPVLAGRWSPRAFAGQAIDETTIGSLFEAARWSASASNLQPWSFIYAARGNSAFDSLLSCLNPSNAAWARQAPLLVIAIAQMSKPDGAANAHARYDLGQAVAQMALQATVLGLHVHQMAGFDAARARSVLGIPAEHEAVTAIAIGRLGDPSSLPVPLQEREAAPRTRKPTSSFVFAGRWPGTNGQA